MRLFPPEIEVGPDEGFTPEKDIFGRKEFGDRLTNIVSSLEGAAVLLLDAPWGAGKSTFAKMWRGTLKQRGIPSLYFDAFANDYHDDAFLALAGEVTALAERTNLGKELVSNFKDRSIKVGKVLLRTTVKLGVQTATAGLVSAEVAGKGIDDIAKAIGEGTAEAVDALLKERLESHNADKQAFSAFGKALQDLATAIARVPENKSVEPKLVFIIDELDRCRPTFALELLEKIKHFFSVPSLIFVLVANLKQLEASVRFSYGTDVDAQTYLQKFYHLRLLFPAGQPNRPDLAGPKYFGHLFGNSIPRTEREKDRRLLIAVLGGIAQGLRCDFRTMERVAAYAGVTLVSVDKENLFSYPFIVGVLCFLKVVSPEAYEAARAGNLTFEQLDAAIHFDNWLRLTDENDASKSAKFTLGLWRWLLGMSFDDDRVRHAVERINSDYNFVNARRLVTVTCDIIDGLSFPQA